MLCHVKAHKVEACSDMSSVRAETRFWQLVSAATHCPVYAGSCAAREATPAYVGVVRAHSPVGSPRSRLVTIWRSVTEAPVFVARMQAAYRLSAARVELHQVSRSDRGCHG